MEEQYEGALESIHELQSVGSVLLLAVALSDN
jgi:hypothetical protein